jgi:hypothetical protein
MYGQCVGNGIGECESDDKRNGQPDDGVQRKRSECDVDGYGSECLYVATGSCNGITDCHHADGDDGIYGNGPKHSGMYERNDLYVCSNADADVVGKSGECDDMRRAKRNIYGERSDGLYVESGEFKRRHGGGEPDGDDGLHGHRSERKLYEQRNADGGGESGADIKSAGESESGVQR